MPHLLFTATTTWSGPAAMIGSGGLMPASENAGKPASTGTVFGADGPRDRPGSSTSFAPIGAAEGVRFWRSGREGISRSTGELDSPVDAAVSRRARAASSTGEVRLKVPAKLPGAPGRGPDEVPVAGSGQSNRATRNTTLVAIRPREVIYWRVRATRPH